MLLCRTFAVLVQWQNAGLQNQLSGVRILQIALWQNRKIIINQDIGKTGIRTRVDEKKSKRDAILQNMSVRERNKGLLWQFSQVRILTRPQCCYGVQGLYNDSPTSVPAQVGHYWTFSVTESEIIKCALIIFVAYRQWTRRSRSTR